MVFLLRCFQWIMERGTRTARAGVAGGQPACHRRAVHRGRAWALAESPRPAGARAVRWTVAQGAGESPIFHGKSSADSLKIGVGYCFITHFVTHFYKSQISIESMRQGRKYRGITQIKRIAGNDSQSVSFETPAAWADDPSKQLHKNSVKMSSMAA